MQRFVLTTKSFIVLPDPKMGYQPHTEEDFKMIKEHGGYFNAWWVHPRFREEVWWQRPDDRGSPRSEGGVLSGQDCSAEPWAASSFVHTWSSVRKPNEPRYVCCLRDLKGEDLHMLEEFQEEVLSFLWETYEVAEDKVWIFAHYPSSARYSTLH